MRSMSLYESKDSEGIVSLNELFKENYSIEADRLLHDPESFGFLFESPCTRDMRIYAQVNGGEIFHCAISI